MKKENAVVDSLEALLQGESMAIHLYDTFIPEVPDPNIKLTFQEIRTGHRRHYDQLIRRLEELGERPKVNLNFSMKMGQLMIDARTQIGLAPQKMIRWALKGEDQGLSAAEEVVKGDLDEVSRELFDFICNDSHEYINKLIDYIQE